MAEAQTAGQGRCFLLELPSELRLQIYGHIPEIADHEVWYRVLANKSGDYRIRPRYHLPPHSTLLICHTITVEYRPLLAVAPLCSLVMSSYEFVPVSRSVDTQRQLVFTTSERLNESVQIANAREITVHIESVASGAIASSENASLLDVVFATFRTIARTSKSELLTVKISDRSPTFRNNACGIIAARRYPGRIKFDVEAKGLSRGMLKMLEDFQK
ncbi:hypothetical protein B0A48_06061 [Cryoendolithus antarcticus]|uniref:F-box domain-containing protein n=1 Tax=Cryoendolithus antarcticus TaxID=1507870 RepID=A0A1V8TCS1_9PEZI|nr:hypothetical protein B0A48_06061 [Cryoendolithus antarcticus]